MALYGRQDYWDERYRATESSSSYDWYLSYPAVRHLLSIQALTAATTLNTSPRRSFPSQDRCRVLILGSGNSSFGEDMIRDGWKGPITNIDFSSVVIESSKKKYCNRAFTNKFNCPQMEFVCADVTQGLPFEDQSFDLIICKGTFDAILCSCGSVANAKTVVAECSRVLANGHGVLFLVSYANADNRVVFLEHDNSISYYWKEVSIHTVRQNSEGRNDYYVYTCRKQPIEKPRVRRVSIPVTDAKDNAITAAAMDPPSSARGGYHQKHNSRVIASRP